MTKLWAPLPLVYTYFILVTPPPFPERSQIPNNFPRKPYKTSYSCGFIVSKPPVSFSPKNATKNVPLTCMLPMFPKMQIAFTFKI